MKTRICNLTLAITVLVLAMGCASRKEPATAADVEVALAATLEDEKELIRATVANAEAVERLMALLAKRDLLFEEQSEVLVQFGEELKALTADYDSSREAFDQAVSEYDAKRREVQIKFSNLVESMKKEVSAEEWKKIAKFQTKKRNPHQVVYGAGGRG